MHSWLPYLPQPRRGHSPLGQLALNQEGWSCPQCRRVRRSAGDKHELGQHLAARQTEALGGLGPNETTACVSKLIDRCPRYETARIRWRGSAPKSLWGISKEKVGDHGCV